MKKSNKKEEITEYTNRRGDAVRKLKKPILAWHIHDGHLKYEDNRKVVSGRVYKVKHDPKTVAPDYLSVKDLQDDRNIPCQIQLCRRGLHASRKLTDAYKYSGRPFISRVEMRGWASFEYDKMVASERKVLWTIRIDDHLRYLLQFNQERRAKEYILRLAKKRRIKNPR